jgi:hypothetical protein
MALLQIRGGVVLQFHWLSLVRINPYSLHRVQQAGWLAMEGFYFQLKKNARIVLAAPWNAAKPKERT